MSTETAAADVDMVAKAEYFPPPKVQSFLAITPCFGVNCTHPMPSRWVRFWQWALLGWTWKKV